MKKNCSYMKRICREQIFVRSTGPWGWSSVCWRGSMLRRCYKEADMECTVLRGVIISERWKRATCQRVERTVNGNTGPACPVISADSAPEASASSRRFNKTSSLRRPLLTDAISHTGSKITPFQSHHCCEGNCSSLSRKSAPPCAPPAKTHIYSYNNTHPQSHGHKILYRIARTHPKKKKTPVNLSLSCFLYPCLYVAGCWIYCDRIHLMSFMFAGLIVLMWALRAHHATYPPGRKLVRGIFGILYIGINSPLPTVRRLSIAHGFG